MTGAVAVDFGATSGRYAASTVRDGRIEFEVIRQVPHGPLERNGKLFWNLDALLDLCREAANYAKDTFGRSTVGIDTWGVDHGFIDSDGNLIDDPVCYRDLSHVRAFESLAPHRARLYELTGCQHQPFNTICQLVARRQENPNLPQAARFLVLPDLLAYLLTGEMNHELTQASTTQLLGLDNRWSAEAFDIAGWPVPDLQPSSPGSLGGEIIEGVHIAHIGSHDTASAVCGFGDLGPDQAFLNVGTWSLCGVVLDQPLATREAEDAAFTNERTVEGRVRFLKNIPGFYVINRIHEELGVRLPIPEWLRSHSAVEERIDLLHPDLYNPESMVRTCATLARRSPKTEAEWAGLALSSLTRTVANSLDEMERLTGRSIKSIRVGGGGSQSEVFCQSLADESRRTVLAGPAEATVLGNLGMQYFASGELESHERMRQIVSSSANIREYSRRK